MTEDPATLDLLLDYYAASTPPLSKHALECLVRQLAERAPASEEAEKCRSEGKKTSTALDRTRCITRLR